jgi:hypothetical protein
MPFPVSVPLVSFAFIGCHPRAAPEGTYRRQLLETTERFFDGSKPPTPLWQLELTRAQVVSLSSEASLAACESALSGGRHSCVLNLPPCLQVTVSHARGGGPTSSSSLCNLPCYLLMLA